MLSEKRYNKAGYIYYCNYRKHGNEKTLEINMLNMKVVGLWVIFLHYS